MSAISMQGGEGGMLKGLGIRTDYLRVGRSGQGGGGWEVRGSASSISSVHLPGLAMLFPSLDVKE